MLVNAGIGSGLVFLAPWRWYGDDDKYEEQGEREREVVDDDDQRPHFRPNTIK